MPGGPSATTGTKTIVATARPTGRARASFGQLRLWFLHQLDPSSPAAHLDTARRITGPLSVETLERALNEIILRHEAFRTTFEVEGDEPVQVIGPFAPRRLNCVDLSSVSAEEQLKSSGRSIFRPARCSVRRSSGSRQRSTSSFA
jgi:hypothetical protein